MMTTLEQNVQSKDDAQVRGWRTEQISKLGFEGGALVELVEGSFDLHYLTHLVQDLGYTPEQIRRMIL